MSLKSTRTAVTALLTLSVIICIAGFVFEGGNEAALTNYGIGAIICLFLVIAVMFKWARCPWCGQLLFRRFYVLKTCPACGRDLETGKKKKGKGGKK